MATRPITSAQLTALQLARIPLVLFAEFDFASGFVRVTNGGYPIDWNGFTWAGVGALGSVSNIREVTGIESVGYAFTISGVDPAKIQTAMGEQYQGRSGRMWAGVIEPNVGLVISPTLLVAGRMDTMPIEYGKQAKVTVNVENKFAAWNRRKMRRFNDADQQAEFPGDLGCQFVTEVAAGREVPWGRG